jgi:predicted transcriptional regulator
MRAAAIHFTVTSNALFDALKKRNMGQLKVLLGVRDRNREVTPELNAMMMSFLVGITTSDSIFEIHFHAATCEG